MNFSEQLGNMRTASEFSSSANNLELLEKVENLVVSWIKQIEQVLAQSEQMRKEADDIGPGKGAFKYWALFILPRICNTFIK